MYIFSSLCETLHCYILFSFILDAKWIEVLLVHKWIKESNILRTLSWQVRCIMMKAPSLNHGSVLWSHRYRFPLESYLIKNGMKLNIQLFECQRTRASKTKMIKYPRIIRLKSFWWLKWSQLDMWQLESRYPITSRLENIILLTIHPM